MDYGKETWQWAALVKVLHGPKFGHRIELETRTKGRDCHSESLGWWRGVGIPEDVLTIATCRVDAALMDHLVTRYGVAGELPLKWGGEPDPF